MIDVFLQNAVLLHRVFFFAVFHQSNQYFGGISSPSVIPWEFFSEVNPNSFTSWFGELCCLQSLKSESMLCGRSLHHLLSLFALVIDSNPCRTGPVDLSYWIQFL